MPEENPRRPRAEVGFITHRIMIELSFLTLTYVSRAQRSEMMHLFLPQQDKRGLQTMTHSRPQEECKLQRRFPLGHGVVALQRYLILRQPLDVALAAQDQA